MLGALGKQPERVETHSVAVGERVVTTDVTLL